jgi:putative heme-binding domain-containing protein
VCASCHRLYGEGGTVGPDLTGADRANLHYFLENAIDPSAAVAGDYKLVNIYTTQGRLVAGIVVEETERAVTVQTATEKVVLSRSDVDERAPSPVSMMPEGLLDKLTPEQLRDLAGYLATKKQVPLPK